MHETTAYDQFLDEREVRTQHRILLRQGRRRFGAANAETEAALNAIEDIERLDRLIDAILTVSSWTELLETP